MSCLSLCDSSTAACQAFLSFTISQSLFNFMFIESGMPSNHLILCHSLHIRWRKFWSFSISPANGYLWLISFRIDGLDLLAVHGTLKSLLSTTVWKHQFFSAQSSLWSNSHVHWADDAIQPSQLLSPPALNFSQHRGLFQWIGSSHQVAKVLEFLHHSFQWIFSVDFL